MSKRKAIKDMMDAVERGHAFTVYGKDGEPLAMVIPWADWQALNKALVEAEERLIPPSQRVLSDPEEQLAVELPDKIFGLPPGSTVLNLQTGEVHQEPGSWTKDWPAGTESP